MKTKDELIDDLLDLAFAEDVGDGDHTTLSTIPADAMGKSRLIIKEDGVLSGVEIARKVLEKVDPSIKMEVFIGDGADVRKGDIAFTAEGPVRSLLVAERTMLNIMQRMSGVATMTRRYQDELKGLHTRVLDTRKTTPGMRMLEKEAVKTGGGTNHRIGLFDMILIKDNHIEGHRPRQRILPRQRQGPAHRGRGQEPRRHPQGSRARRSGPHHVRQLHPRTHPRGREAGGRTLRDRVVGRNHT